MNIFADIAAQSENEDLERVCAYLALLPHGAPITVTEVAFVTRLPSDHVFFLMDTLMEIGALLPDPPAGDQALAA